MSYVEEESLRDRFFEDMQSLQSWEFSEVSNFFQELIYLCVFQVREMRQRSFRESSLTDESDSACALKEETFKYSVCHLLDFLSNALHVIFSALLLTYR